MKLKNSEIWRLAEVIRPHCTTSIEESGAVPDEKIKALVLERTGRHVSSERTLSMISERLCEI